jgi:hypothetical protein
MNLLQKSPYKFMNLLVMDRKDKFQNLLNLVETALKGYYNLAFGDKDFGTGDIDDTSVSNNGDSEQVLATVVSAVYMFTENKKEAWVYATGSTKSRTRLYRMGITKYIADVKSDFHVFGQLEGEWVEFQKDTDYTAFVVRRK